MGSYAFDAHYSHRGPCLPVRSSGDSSGGGGSVGTVGEASKKRLLFGGLCGFLVNSDDLARQTLDERCSGKSIHFKCWILLQYNNDDDNDIYAI